MDIEEIIGGDHHLFQTKERSYSLSHPRQVIYHAAYERYKGPTAIQEYLLSTYQFSVNQSTIYYAWYKIKKKMNELTPQQFRDKYVGLSINRIIELYAAYQLELHIDHPTQKDRKRLDIKQKVRELRESKLNN